MRLFKLVFSIFKWIYFTVLIVIVELVTPLCILILPMYAYRFLVKFASSIFKPKFGEILSGLSAVNGSDDILTRPTYTILLYNFTLGRVSLQEQQKLWMDKVLNVQLPNGQLKYPELRQFVSPWAGFNFWEQDEQFDIKNHIKMYEDPEIEKWKLKYPNRPMNEDFVARVGHRLLKKPFRARQSPWEILMVYGGRTDMPHKYEQVESDQTMMFIRYHHALADGFAITKLLSNVSSGQWFEDPQSSYKFPLWKKCAFMFLYPFLSSAVMIPEGYKYVDKNQWTKRASTPTFLVNYAVSRPIPVERIKTIKNNLGVSFHTVLFAAFTGGIRNYMLETKTKVPKHIHVGIPLPIPGRPDKLTNHVTGGFLKLPVGLASPLTRLAAVEKDINRVRRSLVVRLVGMFGQIFLGSMFTVLIKQARKVGMGTASLSLFPGPPDGLVYLTGEPILTLGAVLDFAIANQAIMISGVSYGGYMKMYIGVDESIIPNEGGIKLLIEKFEEEIDILSKEHIP